MTIEPTPLYKFAISERQALKQDIQLLQEGGKLIGANGEEVTAAKLQELELRREHAEKVIREEYERYQQANDAG